MIWPFSKDKSESFQPGNGMNTEDRKKAFWLIKKLTSLEAWRLKLDAYRNFAAEFEKLAAHNPGPDSGFFGEGNYKKILDELIQFEKAFVKLQSGDRSCFKWGVNGSFAHTFEMPAYIAEIVGNEREYIFDEDIGALKESLRGIRRALAWGAESNQEFEPARPIVTTFFDPEVAMREGPYSACYPLHDVPLVEPLIQVKTNEEFTVTGIWEPNTPGSEMDYRLAGTEAPEVEVSFKRGRERTVWTLLWEDHRYEDGTVPEEDALYFAAPDIPLAPATDGPTRSEANQPCPRAGFWFTPAQSHSRRWFKTGEIMPNFQSEYGATIWQWDQNQQDQN